MTRKIVTLQELAMLEESVIIHKTALRQEMVITQGKMN